MLLSSVVWDSCISSSAFRKSSTWARRASREAERDSSVAEASDVLAPLLLRDGMPTASGVESEMDGASSVFAVSFEDSFLCPLTFVSGASTAPSVFAISVDSSSIGLLCCVSASGLIQKLLLSCVFDGRTLILNSCSSPSPSTLSPATEPLAVELVASPFGFPFAFFFLLPFFFGAVGLR